MWQPGHNALPDGEGSYTTYLHLDQKFRRAGEQQHYPFGRTMQITEGLKNV